MGCKWPDKIKAVWDTNHSLSHMAGVVTEEGGVQAGKTAIQFKVKLLECAAADSTSQYSSCIVNTHYWQVAAPQGGQNKICLTNGFWGKVVNIIM